MHTIQSTFNSLYLRFFHAPVTMVSPIVVKKITFNSLYLRFFHAPLQGKNLIKDLVENVQLFPMCDSCLKGKKEVGKPKKYEFKEEKDKIAYF